MAARREPAMRRGREQAAGDVVADLGERPARRRAIGVGVQGKAVLPAGQGLGFGRVDQAMLEFVQAAGVVVDKPIVLVPMGQSIADVDEALRLYWTFKLRGEDRVAVLARGTLVA